MDKRITKFLIDCEGKIKAAERAMNGARTQELYQKYMDLLWERKENLWRFKFAFEIPLAKSDISDIAFVNKKYNDPKKWDSVVALIDADVIVTLEDLAKYYDIKHL
jgi:hypothetical protein